MANRRDFLSMPAPENYVAGLGRGATGFTTRSDLGPARDGPSEEQIKEALAKRAAQLGLPGLSALPPGRGAKGKDQSVLAQEKEEDEDDSRYQDPENEQGLFAGGLYDKDDEEADRIFKEVDEKMDKRRRARRLVYPRLSPANPLPKQAIYRHCTDRSEHGQITDTFRQYHREAREQAERAEYERKNPKIQQQFADLKRALGTITDEEWANLPEPGDMTGKNRRSKAALRQRFYAVPDSVLAAARDSTELGTVVNDDVDGAATSTAADGAVTNFAKIGEARDRVLQVRLAQAERQGGGEGSAAGGMSTVVAQGMATSIDPRGYLTSLARSAASGAQGAKVGDINRVRELLESVIRTNPGNGPGWIAAARLEELAGRMVAARNVIARGCKHCPRNEDVWLENIRLNEGHNARVIAADAIRANNRSVRLWVEAMKLETDPRSKKRVIRHAIDHVPESEVLWKEAVNLEEDPEDARLMLAKATELIPLSVDLWLALARLETPENAQKVLNRARKAIPTSHEIWIAAARLQEQLGQGQKVNVMRRAVQVLAKESAMPKREEWIAEAERCEEEGALVTCASIIAETLGWGLDEDDDRKETWREDARASIGRGRYVTARAIYAYALRVFVDSKTLWLEAADLERNHGTRETLIDVLSKAVEACPKSEVLWMMLAKERWIDGDVDGARHVLARAFNQNPRNEDIWLAAVKLEADVGQPERARELLRTARTEAPTDRVWMKSAHFERVQGRPEEALDLVTQALQRFPQAPKLWMMKGQILADDLGKPQQAREAYSTGVKACPRSVPLWLLYSRLEESQGAIVRARSVLDRARQAVPGDDRLWAESVRVERRAGEMTQARTLMARAMQACGGRSGLLWSEQIWHLEPRTQRKPRSLEAIKKVDNDPLLFVAVARIFWAERKLDKAQNWFERALVLDADVGDTWAWYYRFLLQHGTEVCNPLTPIYGFLVGPDFANIFYRKNVPRSFPSACPTSLATARSGSK